MLAALDPYTELIDLLEAVWRSQILHLHHILAPIPVSSFKVLPLGLGIQEIIAAATHATGAKYGGPWKHSFNVGKLEGSSNLSTKLFAQGSAGRESTKYHLPSDR